MLSDTKEISNLVKQMDKHLRTELLVKDSVLAEKQLWENTHIKKQIDKRNEQGVFSIEDHIRAMLYSMLSSGITWKRVEDDIDINTGRITSVDKVFFQYDVNEIMKHSPKYYEKEIKGLHFASPYTSKQMEALIQKNIPKLMDYEKKYGSVEKYYQTYVEKDKSCKGLVKALSNRSSADKMVQMGIPLVCEYLRNVGYDIPKPDRHICRILGKDYLELSSKQPVPKEEAFDIVSDLANTSGESIAKTDYILWSYCAKGYGEICTKRKSKCEVCKAKEHCNMNSTR